MLAEIAELEGVGEEIPGRLREKHLAAVPGRHHPGGAVDVHPDVVVVREDRLAAVDAHADSNSGVGESLLRGERGRHGVRRLLEGHEERVAAGIDHDAAVRVDGFADHAVVLGEDLGVAGAELVQETGGALDVGEEERDFAGREGRRLVSRGQSPPPRRRRVAGLPRTARSGRLRPAHSAPRTDPAAAS